MSSERNLSLCLIFSFLPDKGQISSHGRFYLNSISKKLPKKETRRNLWMATGQNFIKRKVVVFSELCMKVFIVFVSREVILETSSLTLLIF